VQVHHPTSYTASSGVFPRRIRTECVREVYGFLNEKEKLNCSIKERYFTPEQEEQIFVEMKEAAIQGKPIILSQIIEGAEAP